MVRNNVINLLILNNTKYQRSTFRKMSQTFRKRSLTFRKILFQKPRVKTSYSCPCKARNFPLVFLHGYYTIPV